MKKGKKKGFHEREKEKIYQEQEIGKHRISEF